MYTGIETRSKVGGLGGGNQVSHHCGGKLQVSKERQNDPCGNGLEVRDISLNSCLV